MPKFINLYEFTEQGIRNYQGTVDRTKSAEAAIEKMGGKLGLATLCVGVGQGVALAVERAH